MTYVTASDLIQQFGAEEIAQRSDRNIPRLVTAELLTRAAAGEDLSGYSDEEQEAVAAALALVNNKLLDAESVVNGYLEGRYSVPLATVPRLVITYVCDIARFQLYDDLATETIRTRYEDAIKMLQQISTGKLSLGIDVAGNKPSNSNVAIVKSETPVWRRDRSRGFI